MAFRADEAAQRGYENAVKYLIPKEFSEQERGRSIEALEDIMDKCGNVIERYPTWHPLVSNHDSQYPEFYPKRECGYEGLDHTICFVNGFITCPYTDGQDIIDSVGKLPFNHAAQITAERVDAKFYHESATPILVRCHWNKDMPLSGTIPISLAMPLLLQKEVPCWEWSSVAETWETMRPYFLGEPHGSRSSLFIDQEAGQAIKKIWNALIYTGMYGNIRV